MPSCSFCHEPGHRIQNCTSSLIDVFEKCIRYNAAYDYYLGLESTYLQMYLVSLNTNLLRAIGYRHDIILKKPSSMQLFNTYIPYNLFIKQFLIYYLNVPNNQHIELINSLSHGKIVIYSQHIHDFFLRNDIRTNWTPTTIATMLLSTRIFSIELKIIKESEISSQLDECAICIEQISQDKYCKLLCNHSFCSSCIFQYIETLYKSNREDPVCPLCRNTITDVMITKSNYKNCLHSITKIKNIYKVNTNPYDEIETFELRIAYLPLFISQHPQFIQMKYAFYVVMRMFIMYSYLECMFRVILYFFKNANSYHNPNMLQI